MHIKYYKKYNLEIYISFNFRTLITLKYNYITKYASKIYFNLGSD